MSARGLETEYMVINPATAWPVQPWAAVVRTAEAAAGSGPVSASPETAADGTARKARDRGASAVEWVVITAIVVAIVTGVGVLISNAVKAKAKNACTQIVSTDTTTGGSSSNCG